jgi:hypothetical protein
MTTLTRRPYQYPPAPARRPSRLIAVVSQVPRPSATVQWRLLPTAFANLCKVIWYTFVSIIAIWLLVNYVTLLINWRWHVMDHSDEAAACAAFGNANGLELKWSIEDGCH